MPEPGYHIGFKELYDAIQTVDGKLDSVSMKLVEHEGRIKNLEQKAEKRWQLYGIWFTAIAAFGASILPLLIH